MKFSITTRLIIMVALSAIVALIVGLVGMISNAELSKKLATAQKDTLPSVRALKNIEGQQLRVRMNMLNHLLSNDAAEMEKIEKAEKKSGDVLLEAMKEYEKTVNDDQDRELVKQDKAAIDAYLATLAPVFEKSRNNEKEEARQLLSHVVVPAYKKLGDAIQAHLKFQDEFVKQQEIAADTAVKNATLLSWSVIVAGILAIASLGLLLVYKIRGTLASMQEAITHIEHERDFRVRVPVKGDDEIGIMAQALNRLLDSLQASLKQIYAGAGQVAGSSEHMAETAHQVATASSNQSASASSMAAAVEQLTVSIAHIGERAIEANQLSADSGKLAQEGDQVIGQTVRDITAIADTMQRTSEHIRAVGVQSNSISSVVAVIREVAEQTNLLALNAAIEAARAGEQGRGFAVVADEVRKLAERTAASTHEISSMVDGIRDGAQIAVSSMDLAVEQVNAGVARAEGANEAIRKIGLASRHAGEMVSEITNAIREQSAASTTLAQQVEQVAQMAEESHAASDESATTAHRLDGLAKEMQRTVAVYTL